MERVPAPATPDRGQAALSQLRFERFASAGTSSWMLFAFDGILYDDFAQRDIEIEILACKLMFTRLRCTRI